MLFIRKKDSLSGLAFGRKIGVSKAAISQWENGSLSISLATLIELSKKTGFSIDQLLFEDLKNGTPAREFDEDQVEVIATRVLEMIDKKSKKYKSPADAAP